MQHITSEEKRIRLQRLYEAERSRLAAFAPEAAFEGAFLSPVFGEGPAGAGVVLIGEAPGGEETAAGRPFVGKAGKQLNELLALAGLDRESLYVTNTVKYRPFVSSAKSVRNRPPRKEEVAAALPLLKQELNVLSPAFVFTLGNVPLSAVLTLCGEPVRTVGACHGKEMPLQADGTAFTLLPLYHPASVIYNPSLKDTLRQDLCFAGQCVRKL